MLPLDDVESTDPRPDMYSNALGIFRSDLQAGHLHCLIRGCQGQVDEPAHLFYFFFFDEIEGIEAFDLSGDLAGKAGSVEMGDLPYSAFAGQNVFPDLGGIIPNSTDQ